MADTDNIYDNLTKYTYESLHTEALNQIADDVDKREGSVVFDMTAPAAVTLAKCFDALYQVAMQSRIQTATGEYLDLCASQNKIYRNPATCAKWRIHIEPQDIALTVRTDSVQGTRFISTNGLNYIYEVITAEVNGDYIVECLTAGASGGRDFGELEETPIVHNLKSVEFVKCLDGGQDEETDAAFRMRWWSIVNNKGYGGNFYDYQTWILTEFGQSSGGYQFDGFFIFPAWAGGGTVKIIPTIKTDEGAYLPADQGAVNALKAWLDPEPVTGKGAGMAPVGHKVTVEVAETIAIDISVSVILISGTELTAALVAKIQNAIRSYFEYQRGDCATTLGDDYPYSYEMLIAISAIETAVHAQSTDIRSVNVHLEIDGIEYSTDYETEFDANHIIYLPVVGAITVNGA